MKPALIRCVAIDDEPLALEVIEKFCARMGGVEVTIIYRPPGSPGFHGRVRSRHSLSST